jgi:hypothetical protein
MLLQANEERNSPATTKRRTVNLDGKPLLRMKFFSRKNFVGGIIQNGMRVGK